jgi:xanthine/uracil permease
MNGMENLTDLVAMSIGVIGALLKGLKKKFNKSTIFIGMLIAGVLTYATTGLIEMFFTNVSQKVIILISFCVGWIANELTEKLDEFVNDVYDIVIDWIRRKFNSKNKKP